MALTPKPINAAKWWISLGSAASNTIDTCVLFETLVKYWCKPEDTNNEGIFNPLAPLSDKIIKDAPSSTFFSHS